MIVRYGSLSAARFEEFVRRDVALIVPCSPLEVHGPHLPLATDIIQAEHYAEAFAERLAEVLPDKHFLLHPTLPLGVDPLPLPGSIGHDVDVVQRVLVRIGESAQRAGISSMIISNFHGAPRHVLAHELACEELSKLGFPAIAPMGLMLGSLVESGLVQELAVLGDHMDEHLAECECHAGALETAIIMAMGHEPDATHRDLPTLDFRSSGGRLAQLVSSLRGRLEGRAPHLPKFLEQLEAYFRVTEHFNEHSYGGAPPLATRELGVAAIERFTELQLAILRRFYDAADPRAEEFRSLFWKNRRLILSGVIEWLFDGGWENQARQRAAASDGLGRRSKGRRGQKERTAAM